MTKTLTEYKSMLRDMTKDYNERVGEKKALVNQSKSLRKEIKNAKNSNQLYEQTTILLQKTAADARKNACEQLEETVTDALKYIFGPDFKFSIELREVGKRIEADFYVESEINGEVIKTKPEDARGGGVVDIISIALRIALIQIYPNPEIKGPIILDEPGKHVSKDYSTQMATFLSHINQIFNRQIIVSTHQADVESIADHAIDVEIKGGKSVVS